MGSERYQEQVATNTEVLDAQTRYTSAQYEYYQALYNYNLAWASIERTMGRRVTPSGLSPAEPANLPDDRTYQPSIRNRPPTPPTPSAPATPAEQS